MEAPTPVYTTSPDKTSASFYGLHWKESVPAPPKTLSPSPSSPPVPPHYNKFCASLERQDMYLRYFSVARYGSTEHANNAAEPRI